MFKNSRNVFKNGKTIVFLFDVMAKTLYDKIFDAHIVDFDKKTGEYLVYIDRHLIHEVTSPQAFDGLRSRGIGVRCPNKVLAVADHNIPTKKQKSGTARAPDFCKRKG